MWRFERTETRLEVWHNNLEPFPAKGKQVVQRELQLHYLDSGLTSERIDGP